MANKNILKPGYQQPYRRDRNRHGGGVPVYVKNVLIVCGEPT